MVGGDGCLVCLGVFSGVEGCLVFLVGFLGLVGSVVGVGTGFWVVGGVSSMKRSSCRGGGEGLSSSMA